MKTDPYFRGFCSFTKINLLLHFLIGNWPSSELWNEDSNYKKWRKRISPAHQSSSILLACQVFNLSATLNPRIMGAQDTWHLWTHGLLYLFLNIFRAQRLSLHLAINPLWCSATYLSTRLLDFFPTYLGRSWYNPILCSQMSKLSDATFLFLVLYSLDLLLLITEKN